MDQRPKYNSKNHKTLRKKECVKNHDIVFGNGFLGMIP